MTETPKGRFNFAALSELGLKFPKFGGWLNVPEKGNDIFDFDLNFFEINAVEGTAIDPQHRIMLEGLEFSSNICIFLSFFLINQKK